MTLVRYTDCEMDRSRDWLRQAERDLEQARLSAGAGLHEWAAFAAQQSAEKAAKALIQHRRGSARGHSVTGLLRQLQDAEPLLDAARELDLVYITSRYPNGLAEGSPSEHFGATTSARLIEHARTIVEFCRSQIH